MPPRTASLMHRVLFSLAPGIAVMVWFFGIGILINVIVTVAACIAAEVLALRARQRSLAPLADGSALVTGVLLGLCLPPLLPIWMIVAGALFALIFGKHIYGGLGHNPFNPAMIGYAVMIVSFPLAMSTWTTAGAALNMHDIVLYKLGAPIADGITMATPLDAVKFRGSVTIDEFRANAPMLNAWTGVGWGWINLAFLGGGLYLVYQRICHWLMPTTMLATLGLLAALFYDGGSSSSLGSPLFHWTSGATMLTAFFIVTDPVTSPDTMRAQIVFAAGIGVLVFIIRSIGAYPDGFAFAVLLMNAATPFLDQMRWRFAWAR